MSLADDRAPRIRRTSSVMPRRAAPADPQGLPSSPFGNFDPASSREDYQRGLGGDYAKQADKEDKEEKDQANKGNTEAADRTRYQQARLEAAASKQYVDGRLVTTYKLYDADGKPVEITTEGGIVTSGDTKNLRTEWQGPVKTEAQQDAAKDLANKRLATFSILGMSDLDDYVGSTFIFSKGEQLDENGNLHRDARYAADTQQSDMDSEKDAMRGRNYRSQFGGANEAYNHGGTSPDRMDATNNMTLAAGVSWLRTISHSDPQTYNEMVDLLNGAGFINDEDVRKGVYSLAAGRGFALAAAELSENNAAGSDMDMHTFLEKIRAENDKAAEDERKRSYTPVTRNMTDPESLKATARSAAEHAIGRSLTDEEAAAFASRFAGQETAMYDQVDAIGRSGKGGTVTGPDASGQAEALLRGDQYDEERAGQMVGGYMDALNQLLGG